MAARPMIASRTSAIGLETPIAPSGPAAAPVAAACFWNGTLAFEIVSPRLGSRPTMPSPRSL